MVKAKLTVFFENPFWVGVFEVEEGEKYKVSKFTFGPEPKEELVQLLILRDFYKLNFLKLEDVGYLKKESKKINPKRMQRKIKKDYIYELKKIKKLQKHKGH